MTALIAGVITFSIEGTLHRPRRRWPAVSGPRGYWTRRLALLPDVPTMAKRATPAPSICLDRYRRAGQDA